MRSDGSAPIISKVAAVIAAAAFATTLAACGSSNSEQNSSSDSSQSIADAETSLEPEAQPEAPDTEDSPEPAVVGGWSINSENQPVLAQEQQELFSKLTANTDAVVGEPMAVVASQIVSGTNWMFLCAHEEDGVNTGWDMVVAYEDLDGNVDFVSETPLDIVAPPVLASQPELVVGGWAAMQTTRTLARSPEASSAWKEAVEVQGEDIDITPMALLGTQVVAGLNYKMLCCGKLFPDQEQFAIYIVTIFAPADGSEASFTDFSMLDLNAFSGQ